MLIVLFVVFNRLRGTFYWFRPIMSLGIAVIVFLNTSSLIASSSSFILAWAGMSMGWGDWDCIATDRNMSKPILYEEGNYNGIQWFAEKLISADSNWLNHCRVCLILMGAYRALFLLPLTYWFGLSALIGFLFLTISFLVASEIGYYTTKLWNFKYMSGGWEHQEVWYGFILGLTLQGVLYGLS